MLTEEAQTGSIITPGAEDEAYVDLKDVQKSIKVFDCAVTHASVHSTQNEENVIAVGVIKSGR